MRKGFALFCAAMMLFSLSACSLLEQSLQSGSASSVPSPLFDSSGTGGDSSSEYSWSALLDGVSIEEQVLVDQDGIVITAKSLGLSDNFTEPAISVLVENNRDIAVTIDTALSSVNGMMVGTICQAGVVVEAGKKANTEIYFAFSDLGLAGISTLKEFEMIFSVCDTDYLPIFESDIVTITTTADAGLEQAYNGEGDVMYEDGGIKFVVQGIDDSLDDGYSDITVYIENFSDMPVCIGFRDMSLNGFMVDDYSTFSVAAGKRMVNTISFSVEDDLKPNGIETIEEMDFSLAISPYDDRMNAFVVTDTLSVSFA